MTRTELYDITAKIGHADENDNREPWLETYEKIRLNPLKIDTIANEYCAQTVANYNEDLRRGETARKFIEVTAFVPSKIDEPQETFECNACAIEISGIGGYPNCDFCEACIEAGEPEYENE